MTVEIDAGIDGRPEIEENTTIALAATKPNINPDQILAVARRRHAGLSAAAARGRRRGPRRAASRSSRRSLRRLEPTTRDIAKINGALAVRRENLRRVITNFGEISKRLAGNDVQVADFVSSQDTVFGAFANQEANIRQLLQEFPGALHETRARARRRRRALRPAQARAHGPDPLRAGAEAGARAAAALLPRRRRARSSTRSAPSRATCSRSLADLETAAPPLTRSAKDLDGTFTELNGLVDGLAYNPPGPDEGYLFYLSWLNHNANSSALLQDAAGPLPRAILMYSCRPLVALRQRAASRPPGAAPAS